MGGAVVFVTQGKGSDEPKSRTYTDGSGVAIAEVVGQVGGYSADGSRDAGLLGEPDRTGIDSAGRFETLEPDRTDCAAIRGSEYRSEGERAWFLGECVERRELEAEHRADVESARESNQGQPRLNPGQPQRPPSEDRSPGGAGIAGVATRYGESYNNQPLGCGGGVYSSDDPSIIAVGPTDYATWPCGTPLTVCGVLACINGIRQDSCPGCGPGHVDLSEAGLWRVCESRGRCEVTIYGP